MSVLKKSSLFSESEVKTGHIANMTKTKMLPAIPHTEGCFLPNGVA